MSKDNKQWTPEQIVDLTVKNKIGYQRIIGHLKKDWTFDQNIIIEVVIAFGSYDQSFDYLEFMDQLEYDYPRQAWPAWADDKGLEDYDNPF